MRCEGQPSEAPYWPLPGTLSSDPPSDPCTKPLVCPIVFLGCACIAGACGLLDGIGSGCPAHRSGYAQKFLGGGGEGTFREVVGRVGMLPYFIDAACTHLLQKSFTVGACLALGVVMAVGGLLMQWHQCAAIGVGTGILYVILASSRYSSMLLQTSASPETSTQTACVFKNVSILGGLIVLIATQLRVATLVMFWISMFGRGIMLLALSKATFLVGLQGLLDSAKRLGLPASKCWGPAAYAIVILGSSMNFIGAVVSSFVCDIYFLKIRVAQWIAIPGGEILLLFLCVVTCVDPLTAFFRSRDVVNRQARWKITLQNAAVIGGLVNLTGYDVWNL